MSYFMAVNAVVVMMHHKIAIPSQVNIYTSTKRRSFGIFVEKKCYQFRFFQAKFQF